MKWILARRRNRGSRRGDRRLGKGKDKPQEAGPEPPSGSARSAEDLQVSVREVGVVDPVTKVDVKSAVSGRVVSLKVREGAAVKRARSWPRSSPT